MIIDIKGFFNWFKKTNDGYDPYYLGSVIAGKPIFNDYTSEAAKVQAVFKNPALLKVFTLQCDLFSLGKIKALKNNTERSDDPFIAMLKKPNPMQSQAQWLWDYCFWSMLGTAYLYVDSGVVEDGNSLYFLNPINMEWPSDMQKMSDKIILSTANKKKINDFNIKYKFEDGTSMEIPFSKIVVLTDLTNGTGNWFKGNSRIDAMFKILSNSEKSLDAKNINADYAGKFLVAGQQDPKNVTKLPMGEDEKEDIESKMNSRKKVHATKSMVEIKRFVDDLRALDLDKAYLSDYYLIGSMYNIPKDVLEAYQSSTYENQEKARGSHISYTLQPKANNFTNSLMDVFKYSKINIEMSWDHLPFMQVFEKDRVNVSQTKIITFEKLVKLGVSLEEANAFCGTKFTKINGQANNQGAN